LESYKVPLTRSKIKRLEIHQETQDSTSEVENTNIMGDHEEKRNEIPKYEREINDRQRNPRRRARYNPLNLQREKHQFPTLPQVIFPFFYR
jgi:hypothetical protein